MVSSYKKTKTSESSRGRTGKYGFIITDMKSPKSMKKTASPRNLRGFHVANLKVSECESNIATAFPTEHKASSSEMEKSSSNWQRGFQITPFRIQNSGSYFKGTLKRKKETVGAICRDFIPIPSNGIVDYGSSDDESLDWPKAKRKTEKKVVEDYGPEDPNVSSDMTVKEESENSSITHDIYDSHKAKWNADRKQKETPMQICEKSKLLKKKYLLNVLKRPPLKDSVKVKIGLQQTNECLKQEERPAKQDEEAAFPRAAVFPTTMMKIHKYSMHKGTLAGIGFTDIKTTAKSLDEKALYATNKLSGQGKLLSSTKTVQQDINDTAFEGKADTPTPCQSLAACEAVSYYSKAYYSKDELIRTKYSPGFIDTHCHLDFLFSKTKHLGTFAKYQATREGEDIFPVSFEGCVAVFCQPWTFKMISWWENFMAEANVWATFGCHPHFCNSFGDEAENYLKHALQQPKTVALGEIGLDYSFKNSHSRDLQQVVFRRQLQIALEFKKPIVIHCREASRDCINILKELIPRDYTIHRHCFTGDWIEAEEWLSTFSNLYLGITPLVTHPYTGRSCNVRDVIRHMPLNRLLLETDTPYFRPHSYRQSQWSHPGMAINVAAEVAILKNKGIQEILEYARSNTTAVYGV